MAARDGERSAEAPMPVIDRGHGRVPRQSRSRATLVRIEDAAEALFVERGYDGTTVGEIVARARCSVGSFYARFNDKEALLHHLHDRHGRRLIERIDFICGLLRAENAPLETAIRQMVRTLLVYGTGRRALARVFIQRSGVDAAFRLRHADSWADMRARLRPVLLTRRREIARPDPERAVDFVLQLIHAGWTDDALHHGTGEAAGRSSGDTLIDELTEACIAYLSRPAAAAR